MTMMGLDDEEECGCDYGCDGRYCDRMMIRRGYGGGRKTCFSFFCCSDGKIV